MFQVDQPVELIYLATTATTQHLGWQERFFGNGSIKWTNEWKINNGLPEQPVQQEEEVVDNVEQFEENPRLSSKEVLESLKNIHHYFLSHQEDSSIEARKVQSLNPK